MEERLAYIADHLGFSWTGNTSGPLSDKARLL